MVANKITIGLTYALSLIEMFAIGVRACTLNNNLSELPPT